MSNPIKSAEMAPVLQSMQDYICNHFTDELMDEVSSAVSLGLVEDLDIDAEGGKPVVQRNESKIIRTEFGTTANVRSMRPSFFEISLPSCWQWALRRREICR